MKLIGKGHTTSNGMLKVTTHYEEALEEHSSAKGTRAITVNSITVTTPVGTWDGDEVSQTRMSRVGIAMVFEFIKAMVMANPALQPVYDAILANPLIDWKMADNEVEQVSVEQLMEALTLAGQEQSDVW